MEKRSAITVRYMALDRCLQNESVDYTLNTLLKYCNSALELNRYDKISRRTLQNDLVKIQGAPYHATLVTKKVGHETAYRYSDPNYSLFRHLNKEDTAIVQQTIALLERYKDIPQYDWARIILKQLQTEESIEGEMNVVSFANNYYLKGREHFAPLIGYIINKQALTLTYQIFGMEPEKRTISPYHLKEYNNRWFLIAYDESRGDISNFALDRILDIKNSRQDYKESDIDFDEYFEDIIGVSVVENNPVQTIKLKVFHKRYHYIETKPIHGSQKLISNESNDYFKVITIQVRWNRELEALLLSYGRDIEILEPAEIRDKMIWTIQKMLEKYKPQTDAIE